MTRRSHPAPAAAPAAPWTASLDLDFRFVGGRTRLARRAHAGPLVVQRPFHPEGPVCHAYVVHPPGGVVAGDELAVRVHVGPEGHALITTPAAAKFYRSTGARAQQVQELTLDDAALEWLPQETILFPEARARLATRVRLGGRARFLGWEILCLGRAASGLAFGSGHVAQDFELWAGDEPLYIDRFRLAGESEAVTVACGLGGHPVLGTLLAHPADEALVELARSVARGSAFSACTRVGRSLVVRAVATAVEPLWQLFVALWSAVRPPLLGRPATCPRIWSPAWS